MHAGGASAEEAAVTEEEGAVGGVGIGVGVGVAAGKEARQCAAATNARITATSATGSDSPPPCDDSSCYAWLRCSLTGGRPLIKDNEDLAFLLFRCVVLVSIALPMHVPSQVCMKCHTTTNECGYICCQTGRAR